MHTTELEVPAPEENNPEGPVAEGPPAESAGEIEGNEGGFVSSWGVANGSEGLRMPVRKFLFVHMFVCVHVHMYECGKMCTCKPKSSITCTCSSPHLPCACLSQMHLGHSSANGSLSLVCEKLGLARFWHAHVVKSMIPMHSTCCQAGANEEEPKAEEGAAPAPEGAAEA